MKDIFSSHSVKSRFFFFILAVFLIVFSIRIEAQPTALVVTNLADSGPGTLRQMISSSSSGASITFAINGTIDLTNGEYAITNDLTISGPGSNNLVIDAHANSRIFNIASNISVLISGLTIQNGAVTNSADGGGVYNAGSLVLAGILVSSNSSGSGVAGSVATFAPPTPATDGSSGGDGGGIYNVGKLALANCSIIGNRTGAGGLGASSSMFVGGTAGGAGGDGGGIFNVGNLMASDCLFAQNQTGSGASGGNGPMTSPGGNGGNGGDGGAIYNMGTIVAQRCTISGNGSGFGGNGGSNEGGSYFGALGGAAGDGGDGSGCYNSGVMRVFASAVENNTNGSGGIGGKGGEGGPGAISYASGAGGNGGDSGVYNIGTLILNTVQVTGNTSGNGGAPGFSAVTSPPYGDEANPATGVTGAKGGNGGTSGGIDNAGTLVLLGNTLSGNVSGNGANGAQGGTGGNNVNEAGGTGGTGGDGGDSGPGGIAGLGGAGGAGGTGGTNGVSGPPGNPGNSPTNGTPDLINSGEIFGTAPRLTIVSSNDAMEISFTNGTSASFTVFVSTDPTAPLASWQALSPATQISTNQFQVFDYQSTNYSQRFYLLGSP